MDLIPEDGSGVATANTYQLLETADAYHASCLHHESWEALDADTRTVALIEMFRVINQFAWRGERATTEQAGEFPRRFLRMRNSEVFFPADALPPFLLELHAEGARLRALTDVDAQSAEGIERSVTMGDASSVTYEARLRTILPPHLMRLASPYLAPVRTERA